MVALVIALQYRQKAFDAVVAKDALRGALTAQTAFFGRPDLGDECAAPLSSLRRIDFVSVVRLR